MAKTCSREKKLTEPVCRSSSASSVPDKGTAAALAVTPPPASEEGKQHIKPWPSSRARQRTLEQRGTVSLFTWEHAWAAGGQEEHEVLLSRGPRLSRSPAEGREHRQESHHGCGPLQLPRFPQKPFIPSMPHHGRGGQQRPHRHSVSWALGQSFRTFLGKQDGRKSKKKKRGGVGELQIGP